MITAFLSINIPPHLRFYQSSKCASEPCMTTKQVSYHLEENCHAWPHKVLPLTVITLWLAGLQHVILCFPQRTSLRSPLNPVTSSGTWKRWTKHGGGGGAKMDAKGCSLPIMWRPYRPTKMHYHTHTCTLRDTTGPLQSYSFYFKPPTLTLFTLLCNKDKT